MIKSNTHPRLYIFPLLCLIWVNLINVVLTHPAIESDKPVGFTPDLDLVEDDGNAENAILNYLFAKQFINRMRHQLDIRDLQRKRSYWKQCAFNAVSCFG